MAVVYKAEDAILGRCVALKTLHRHYAEELSFRVRFKQEAQVMASLDHENIVKVYDISQDGEIPFIVAEYIRGRDVGDVLKSAPEGRLNEQYTRRIVEQLLSAIDYAHKRGIIHRDIKPSNVLLNEEGTVKVADFGIARIVEDEEVGKPGEIIGSARYMAPERLKGEKTTPQSDLYSVAILLYHCLTGRPPFSGDARSVARQHIRKDPVPPRKLNKAISLHLQAVILKALSKNPEDRYPSASAMLNELRRDARMSTAEFARAVGSRKRSSARKKRRGSRKTLLLPAMLVLLLLLGGATAAAGLKHVDLGGMLPPWGDEEVATAVQPTLEDPLELAEALQDPEEQTAESLKDEVSDLSEDPSKEGDTVPEDLQTTALVPVPSVDAYFDYFAVQTLENSGFRPKVVYGYREGYATSGVAWGTDPAVGTLLPLGSTITVYVTPKNQSQQPQPQPPLQPPPQIQQPQVQPPPLQLQPSPPQMQPPLPQVQQPPQIQPLPQLQPQVRG
jgi:serine/threonine protein kinase